MPAIFHVDQTATFSMVMFLSSAPKLVYGSQTQDTTKDGVLKWELQVVAAFQGFGGKVENEVLKVSIAAPSDPAQSIGGPQPVELVGFRVGVTPAEKVVDKNGNEKIRGGSAWYQADQVRPLSAAGSPRKSSDS